MIERPDPLSINSGSGLGHNRRQERRRMTFSRYSKDSIFVALGCVRAHGGAHA
jgi:hypothetical protein